MPKITFLPDGATIEVPIGTTLLAAAKLAHARVGYACGGVCACSTCHVYVKQGMSVLSEQEEEESDILDKAFDVRATSRLSCQSKVQGDGEVSVESSVESRDAWLNEHPEERH